MTTTTDRRRGPRGRIRYLCCTCGTQRTASMNYHPTPPTGVEEPQGARWLQWLKCETCDAAGWHAGLSSDHPDLRGSGDHEEDLNRAHDRDRRRVNRLLAWVESAGVDVRWLLEDDMTDERMSRENVVRMLRAPGNI